MFCSVKITSVNSLQAGIAELASTVATDVGMHVEMAALLKLANKLVNCVIIRWYSTAYVQVHNHAHYARE